MSLQRKGLGLAASKIARQLAQDGVRAISDSVPVMRGAMSSASSKAGDVAGGGCMWRRWSSLLGRRGYLQNNREAVLAFSGEGASTRRLRLVTVTARTLPSLRFDPMTFIL